MGFIQVTAWGANIKSFVTNDETEFRNLTFLGLIENSKI
jgi:hypothetical protein